MVWFLILGVTWVERCRAKKKKGQNPSRPHDPCHFPSSAALETGEVRKEITEVYIKVADKRRQLASAQVVVPRTAIPSAFPSPNYPSWCAQNNTSLIWFQTTGCIHMYRLREIILPMPLTLASHKASPASLAIHIAIHIHGSKWCNASRESPGLHFWARRNQTG